MLKSHIIAAEIPKLRRYARALVGNESEADDLVQDTLERALSRLHLWRGGDHPPVRTRRWLFTILHTLHIDGARGRARTPAHDDLDDTIRDPVYRPEDSVTKCEVSSALQQLPFEQRQIVLLIGIEGLSYAETAQLLNVPIGTVMSRLARGRDRMRQLLERPAASPAAGMPATPPSPLRRVK